MRAFAICLFLLAGPALAEPNAGAMIASYSAAYRALGLAPTALSYRENIAALVRETDIPAQRALFSGAARQAAALQASSVSPCQVLDLKRIAFESQLHLEKLDLLERFAALGPAAKPGEAGLFGMPLGRDWYRYFLKRWLTTDVTPEQLMDFGKAELDSVLARYRRLQAAMGYTGRDREFRQFLAGPRFRYAPPQTPQADYEARQQIVYRHLGKLFPPHSIAPARVRESTRGADFPADGFYDSGSRTFYFNKAKPYYGRRNLDMLLLHESTPGHHFQSNYAAQAQACASASPGVFYSAFAEGWSAYVEEFGRDLGLYVELADELGAVEWDLVRSIRVVLDVGINDQGWSEQRALDYWHEQLPMLPELAAREIARVRDWPVQAITYKLGAHRIRQLRAAEQARLGAAFDIRTFHHALLRNGSVPLALLGDALATPAPAVPPALSASSAQ